jgi:hypothetical protein
MVHNIADNLQTRLEKKTVSWVCPWNAETWWVLQVAGGTSAGNPVV